MKNTGLNMLRNESELNLILNSIPKGGPQQGLIGPWRIMAIEKVQNPRSSSWFVYLMFRIVDTPPPRFFILMKKWSRSLRKRVP